MECSEHIFARGAALLQQRQFAEAEQQARRGLVNHPDDGRLWQVSGVACWAMSQFGRARQALETASCLRPLFPLARIALAECYVRFGLTESARYIYEFLAEGDHCPVGLLAKVAAGLGRIGDDQRALQVCRKLARLEPKHHAAFFGMAYYMARLGYPLRGCLRRLGQAHRLAPETLHYRVNLAFACAGQEQFRKAANLLREVAPEAVACACWVRGMVRIFEKAGEDELVRRFAERLEELER